MISSAQRRLPRSVRSTRWKPGQPGETGEEVRRLIDRREIFDGLGAVPLADAGDDRLLGAEITVQIARAHARLGADLLHRGLMEAGAGETGLGRVEDFGAAIRLQLGIGATHDFPAFDRL